MPNARTAERNVLRELCGFPSHEGRSTTSELAARIAVLEEHMRRVLLIVGAAGTMLAEVRRDERDEA
jgi:hypothetical protein